MENEKSMAAAEAAEAQETEEKTIPLGDMELKAEPVAKNASSAAFETTDGKFVEVMDPSLSADPESAQAFAEHAQGMHPEGLTDDNAGEESGYFYVVHTERPEEEALFSQ